MTVVFVHGNPENTAIWGPLLDELGRDDTVCLSPPGFGAPMPPGFEATVTGYRAWLIGELEAIGGPVDLIGHDWGGAHVVNVAMARPDLLRSWVSDVVGVFDPDYVWHQWAQAWQTPEVGEKSVAAFTGGTLDEKIERLTGAGIPENIVSGVAPALDDEMGRCILTLYRSAAQPAMAELGHDLGRAAERPGLSILATNDTHVGSDEMRRRAADRAGARTEVLDGLNHWWMAQDPARAAALLKDFLNF